MGSFEPKNNSLFTLFDKENTIVVITTTNKVNKENQQWYLQ